ncbi:MAG TPA: GDP-L-fucose synthase [Thermoanaerobaculia bacterium]|nr:GDP-L-fucose synthase [Thermoanaerobaculia bacterium]
MIRGRRVLLTGGGGFLGRVLRARLEERGPSLLLAPRSSELDLLDPVAVHDYLRRHRPQIVIHGAAQVGGIGANRDHPGRFFYANAAMGIHLIEEARLAGVEKFVCIGTVCSYPKFAPVPFREADLWNGYPEETNAPYGLAKKMLLVQLQAYRQEYQFRGIFLLPANLYGPGDNFEPATSHVIPAMIRKFVEARDCGSEDVVLWGDGSPTREFLYVDDAADGIIGATELYDQPEPLNLGTGEERSIRDVATLVAQIVGYRGRISWDTSKPNGQPRRKLDTTRAREAFGFQARTPFEEGLRRTVEWFIRSRA